MDLLPLLFCISLSDDLTRSNMGSSGDSEKILQRLNDELREAQDLANTEKHKSMELLGNIKKSLMLNTHNSIPLYTVHAHAYNHSSNTCNKANYILQVSWRKREKKISNKLMNLRNRSNFFKVNVFVV